MIADERSTAHAVATAVLAVPGVVDLDGGVFGEVATYLPGERVVGVQLSDESCAVHIVVDLRYELRDVAAQAAAAASEAAGRVCSVTVEDVVTPPAAVGDSSGGAR